MKKWLPLLVVLYPSLSVAMLCPGNFNQVDVGMTIDQVTQLCGKPDKIDKSTREDDNMPQEWSFFIPQTVSVNTLQQASGTMKTSVAFDASGKAINITVNGIGVGASSICGTNIQLGDSRETIKAACGDPSFINKQNAPGTAGVGQGSVQPIAVTEFTYNLSNPVTLVFENGIFRGRK